MLLLLLALILSILLCATIGYALVYFGLFDEIVVRVGSPPYAITGQSIAYKRQKACYSDASLLFTEVCSLVPKLNTFGIYLDQPNDANRNRCRFLVGVILPNDSQEFEANKALLESKGYTFGQLPDVDHVVHTVFPFRTAISVAIAIRRVYPVIRSYIVEHNLCAHPALEVYDQDNIYFMFPLAKQIQFEQLYGSDDAEETSDEDNSEDDGPEDEKLIDEIDGDYNDLNTGIHTRLRSSKSKKSSNSSTSSSFEELLAEECHKDS